MNAMIWIWISKTSTWMEPILIHVFQFSVSVQFNVKFETCKALFNLSTLKNDTISNPTHKKFSNLQKLLNLQSFQVVKIQAFRKNMFTDICWNTSLASDWLFLRAGGFCSERQQSVKLQILSCWLRTLLLSLLLLLLFSHLSKCKRHQSYCIYILTASQTTVCLLCKLD